MSFVTSLPCSLVCYLVWEGLQPSAHEVLNCEADFPAAPAHAIDECNLRQISLTPPREIDACDSERSYLYNQARTAGGEVGLTLTKNIIELARHQKWWD